MSHKNAFPLGRALFILVTLTGVVALLRCGPTKGQLAAAWNDGYQAGFPDGLRDGDAAGYAATVPVARREAYSSALKTLYESDNFRRKPLWTTTTLAGSFLVGFLLQYLLLYLARVWGVPDIDRIVLSRHLTQVNFDHLRSSEKQRKASQITSLLIMLMISSTLTRCDSLQDEYNKGRKDGRDAGYIQGWATGETRGTTDGTAAGKAAAYQAAQSGEAWQLYWRLAAAALATGIVIGLGLQYAILLGCRRSGRLDQFQTVTFVPAMKRSLAYSIFENCRKLEVEKQATLRKVHADSAVKKAAIEAAFDSSRRRIMAASSIEDLANTRLLELANEEFSKIISAHQPEEETR